MGHYSLREAPDYIRKFPQIITVLFDSDQFKSAIDLYLFYSLCARDLYTCIDISSNSCEALVRAEWYWTLPPCPV